MAGGIDVTSVRRVLPRPEVDPRLLVRAAGPGRVRGIALDAWSRALASPRAAGGIFRRALRDARALHSRERRFVADVLYDLVRARGALTPWTASADPPLSMWLAWLVHLGLPLPAAADAWTAEGHAPVAFEPAVALAETWCARLAHLPASDAAASLAGVPGAAGAELLRSLGDELVPFLDASNARAPVVLRAHTVARDRLLTRLRGIDIAAEPGRWAPEAVVVPTGTAIPPAVLAEVEVQDEASQLVAALVAPAPGERVLDWCAGAGGKTLALGAALAGDGVLWATDVRGQALAELKRRAHGAGVRVRTALLRDDVPSCDLGGPFDAVLVDAPCMGTGVWRRHPELRWRLDDLAEITALQDAILEAASHRVRPGGRLIFATCSVLKAEGEDRVAAFLARRPAFRSVSPAHAAPWLDPTLVRGDFVQTWPHEHGTDGFFAAVLRRG